MIKTIYKAAQKNETTVAWMRVCASELTRISATRGSPHTRSHPHWSGLRLEVNIVSCRRKQLRLYLTDHHVIEKCMGVTGTLTEGELHYIIPIATKRS